VVEDREARPVKLIPAEATMTERIEAILTPVLAPLAKVLIVLVLVIFFAGQNTKTCAIRFIRLVGKGKLTLTTRTLDEAGLRISRFILHQSVINGGFGVVGRAGPLGHRHSLRAAVGVCRGDAPVCSLRGHVAGDVVPRGARIRAVRGLGPMLATLALSSDSTS